MKRIFVSFFILAVLFVFSVPAFATENVIERSSITILFYSAKLSSGGKNGAFDVNYNVQAGRRADFIGIESIEIYKSNGEYVTTVTGTIQNSLITTNTSTYSGTYTKALTSGVSYYAKVTVFAEIGSTRDSRTITTNTVKAP